jgi:hypothetical protein
MELAKLIRRRNMRAKKIVREYQEQILVPFVNGYTASIIRGSLLYGTEDTYELAVMTDRGMSFKTPITDDVLQGLKDTQVLHYLYKIKRLPSIVM